MPNATHFILYSRSYCHLCDDMAQALLPIQQRHGFSLDVRDVDADPQALAEYDELVPVLLGQHGDAPFQRICHYFLDEACLLAFLDQANANYKGAT
jgi:thiol-disulfide isomerase/thioredoxin